MTHMLYIFDKICQKHNITYFVIGGTLLGAVVYKGWIPWDGDIDIEILKDDWPKLNKVLKDELPSDLWLQSEETDKHYKSRLPKYIKGKVRDLTSCYVNCQDKEIFHNGFMIDLNLFYLDKDKVIIPDNTKIDYLYYNDIYPLKRVLFDNIKINIPNNSKKYLKNNYGKKYYLNININKRYPHEGLVVPNKICNHHPKLYPKLYPNL